MPCVVKACGRRGATGAGDEASFVFACVTRFLVRRRSGRSPHHAISGLGQRIASIVAVAPQTRSLILRSRAHFARRLEGWSQVRCLLPSFETALEKRLLRMRGGGRLHTRTPACCPAACMVRLFGHSFRKDPC